MAVVQLLLLQQLVEERNRCEYCEHTSNSLQFKQACPQRTATAYWAPFFMSKNALSELLQRAKREKQAAQAVAPPAAVPACLFDKCAPCSASHAISRDCLYIPDFLDASDASNFAAHIEASSQSWGGWVRLHRRSLLNLGGVPHPSGTIAERLPPSLGTLCQRVCEARALPFVPDQCLLNR